MSDHNLGAVKGARASPRAGGFNLNLAPVAAPARRERHGESLDDLKARVDPLDIIERLTGVRLVPKGDDHDAPCPFCQHPSDRELKFRAFAGGGFNCVKCGTGGGSILDFVMKWIPCGFAAAVSRLRDMAGGAPSDPEEIKRKRENARKRTAEAAKREAEKRERKIADAKRLWNSATEELGAEAVAYLTRRKLAVPARGSLRWAKAEGAILAPARDHGGALIGLSRIYVEPNAEGKTERKFYGTVGGGFVPLGAEPVDRVAYIEGVEDGLALLTMGLETSVRCALSADGLTAQTLPSGVAEVAIYADVDKPQDRMPNGIGLDRAERAAERFAAERVRVAILVPDREGVKDANDALRAGAGFRIWREVEPAQDGAQEAPRSPKEGRGAERGPDVAPDASDDPDAHTAAWNAWAEHVHEETAEHDAEYPADDEAGRSLVLSAFTRSMLSSAVVTADAEEQLDRIIDSAMNRPDGRPSLALVKGTVGLGKTEALVRAAVKYRPKGLVIAVPRVDLGDELKDRLDAYFLAAVQKPPKIIVYRGRTKEVLGAPKGGDRMCLKSKKLVDSVMASGVNVFTAKSLCDRPAPWVGYGCEFAGECRYLRQMAEISDAGTDAILIITHAHLYTHFSIPAGFETHVLIVDEKPEMAEQKEIEPAALTDARMWDDDVPPVAEAVAATARETGRRAAALREAGVTPNDLRLAADHLDHLYRKIQADVAEADHGAPLKAALDATKRSRHREVAMFLRGVALELGDGLDDLQANLLEIARGTDGAEREAFVARRVKRPAWFNPDSMSLVLLDATGDRGLTERWIGQPVEYIETNAPMKGTVFQITTSTYSKYALIGRAEAENNMRETANKVRLIYWLHGGSLFVDATKAIIDVLRPMVEAECPEIVWMWFQADRGSDAAKHCRAGIVIGRELPDLASIEGAARCFVAGSGRRFIPAPIGRGGRPDLVRAERERLMRNGSTVWAETMAHPDPTAQAVLESVREASVVQAAGRLRMVHEEGKTLYLFGSLPVPIEVDRLVEEHELANALPIAVEAVRAVREAGFALVDPAKWARDAYRVAPLMGLVADLVGAAGNPHAPDKESLITCVGVSAVEVGLRAGKRGPARKAWLVTPIPAEEAIAAAKAAGHNITPAKTVEPVTQPAPVEPVPVSAIERRTGAGGDIRLTLVMGGAGRKVHNWKAPRSLPALHHDVCHVDP